MNNRYSEKIRRVRDAVIAKTFTNLKESQEMMPLKKPSSTRFRRNLSLLDGIPQTLDKNLSAAYAALLHRILADIEGSSSGILTKIKLLAELYETDRQVYEDCGDKEGVIAEIYIRDAKDLFVTYALSCQQKEELLPVLLRICEDDTYGVRSSVINCVGKFLQEEQIRILIERMQLRAEEAEERDKLYTYTYIIQCLARQVKDIELFEQTLETMEKQMESMMKEV